MRADNVAQRQKIKKLNIEKIKADFPILKTKVNGKRLVYLDNTATSQKPKAVIDALIDYYQNYNANIHRGVHTLSEKASAKYENVRVKVAKFINAKNPEEIVFTRGTTESLNLVAHSWGLSNLEAGDEVVTTEMEHHSNFVPWQQLAKKQKAVFKVAKIDKHGHLDLDNFDSLVTKKTKIVAVARCSNVLGTVNDVRAIAKIIRQKAHAKAIFVVDGAQAVPHLPTDVQDWDCDFLAFSAHKMLGPTGVGVLYGKKELLDKLQPHHFGGGMVQKVEHQETTWKETPWKFEAGTVNIADVIAFGKSIDYLEKLGMKNVSKHTRSLVEYAVSKLSKIKGMKIYGPTDIATRTAVVSFNVECIHPHDLSTILDHEGIAIRGGHHCAQPLMNALGINSCARASFYIYNTKEDVDALVKGIVKAKKIFDKGKAVVI